MRRRSRLSLPLVAAALLGGLAVAWQLTAPAAPVLAALENDQDLAAGVRLVGPETADGASTDPAVSPQAAPQAATPLAAAPEGGRDSGGESSAATDTAVAGVEPEAAAPVIASPPTPASPIVAVSAGSSAAAKAIEAPFHPRPLATKLAPEPAATAAIPQPASPPPAAAPVTVRVQVLDPQGTGVAGARVIATSFARDGEVRPPRWIESAEGGLEQVPLTDAQGWSTLVVPAMARLRLTVLTPGAGQVLHTRDVRALLAGEEREVVLRTPSSGPQQTAPDAGAQDLTAPALPGTWSVQAWSPEGRALSGLRWTSQPLAEVGGTWTLPERSPLAVSGTTLLPGPEPHVALLEAPGFAPRLVVPAPTEPQRPQRLELQPGATLLLHTRGAAHLTAEALLPIEGPIPTNAGSEAPHPRTCALRWVARSSDAGWLRLECLPTGIPLQLSLEPRSGVLPTVVTLAPGEQRQLDLAPMGGPHTLSGQLLTQERRPLAGRELWLVPAARAGRVLLAPDVQPTRRLFTDARGSFHLEGLPRAAWWLAPAPGSGLLAEASWFECLPGQDAIQVTVTGRASVPGRLVVRDGEGLPVADAAVRIEDARGQLLALRRTDARGAVVTSVPQGSGAWVQVLASAICGRSARAPLTGAAPCLLEVERGRAIQVLVHGPDGHVVPGPFEAVLTVPNGTARASPHTRPVITLRIDEDGPHGLVVRDGQGRLAVTSVEGDGGSGPRPLELRAAAALELVNPQGVPLRWELRQGGTALRAGILHASSSTRIHAQAGEASLRITAPGVESALEQELTIEDGGRHAFGLPR